MLHSVIRLNHFNLVSYGPGGFPNSVLVIICHSRFTVLKIFWHIQMKRTVARTHISVSWVLCPFIVPASIWFSHLSTCNEELHHWHQNKTMPSTKLKTDQQPCHRGAILCLITSQCTAHFTSSWQRVLCNLWNAASCGTASTTKATELLSTACTCTIITMKVLG